MAVDLPSSMFMELQPGKLGYGFIDWIALLSVRIKKIHSYENGKIYELLNLLVYFINFPRAL